MSAIVDETVSKMSKFCFVVTQLFDEAEPKFFVIEVNLPESDREPIIPSYDIMLHIFDELTNIVRDEMEKISTKRIREKKLCITKPYMSNTKWLLYPDPLTQPNIIWSLKARDMTPRTILGPRLTPYEKSDVESWKYYNFD